MVFVIKKILTLFLLSVHVLGQSDVLDVTDLTNDTLDIHCNRIGPEINATNIRNVNLNCSTPNIIYSEYLSSLQIGHLNTLKLIIEPNKNNAILNATQFVDLNVETLVIDYKFDNGTGMERFMPLSGEIIFVLDKVRSLELSGVIVMPLLLYPATNSTTCLLESLRIETSNFKNISYGWLRTCKYLVQIYIAKLRQRNGTKEVRRKILAGLNNLRTLDIHNCYIEELEDELEDLTSLQRLNVAHNQIHYALSTTILPALEEWDLSYNHIFASSIFSTSVSRQPRLRVVSLAYNQVLDLCDRLDYRTTVSEQAKWHRPLSGQALHLPLVQRFSIRGTITTEMCFGNMQMDALEYFDVSDTKISAIHFKSLPRTKSRRLEINVAGCPITDIPPASFTQENYQQLGYEELRITGLNVVLDCDCDDHFWLARAVRERSVVLDRVVCRSGEDISVLPAARLNCTRFRCGACECRRYWQTNNHSCDECVCRRYWQDNATDVECSGELRAIPREPGLRRLYAAGNLVENVTADDIPDTLIYLDLSKNHIARMSAEASAALFRVKARRVKFLGNPIICDCENKPFIEELMDHFDQVEDYSLLTCIDDGRYIRDVVPDDLCFGTSRLFMSTVLTSIGVIIGVAGLVAGVYYRFGRAMKVYLYSKGLCLSCLKESEIDADRPFDAFISFSHSDLEFVTDSLLPGLEGDPYNYNICVHYRNWVAGELIPNQIDKSVEESRRTIIVLSKNFIESIWGLLEFRTAHLSALKEGRSRVIIVILDDILEDDNLDGELRSYLKNNTYVKWGDPWFWDKLRYALPHRTRNESARLSQIAKMSTSQQNLTPMIMDSVSTDSAIEMGHLSSSSLSTDRRTE